VNCSPALWFSGVKCEAVTKKTQEAAGFSFSEIRIYQIFCRAEVGKKPENPRFSWLLV
jgi:hypothetical protein